MVFADANAREYGPGRGPDPKAYERANYMMMLQSWEGV